MFKLWISRYTVYSGVGIVGIADCELLNILLGSTAFQNPYHRGYTYTALSYRAPSPSLCSIHLSPIEHQVLPFVCRSLSWSCKPLSSSKYSLFDFQACPNHNMHSIVHLTRSTSHRLVHESQPDAAILNPGDERKML